jgi:hypothetical protein
MDSRRAAILSALALVAVAGATAATPPSADSRIHNSKRTLFLACPGWCFECDPAENKFQVFPQPEILGPGNDSDETVSCGLVLPRFRGHRV